MVVLLEHSGRENQAWGVSKGFALECQPLISLCSRGSVQIDCRI